MDGSQVRTWGVSLLLVAVVLWAGVGAFLTDPYFPWTTVRAPYRTSIKNDGTIELVEVQPPVFRRDWFSRLTAYVRAGSRILIYRWIPERKLGHSTAEVLAVLHDQRFQPDKPYVITGAHYSDLYVRNLGIFFNELTNERLEQSPQDLQNRQRLALQTVALDLAFLRANGWLVTTIAPLGGSSFTGINIYTEPSDSLYAVLFTLNKLKQAEPTRTAANSLLADNKEVLQRELLRYLQTVIDPRTLTIRNDIHLSGARDGVKRTASFYDTVIAWQTVRLADQLQLIPLQDWPAELQPLLDGAGWKQTIIDRYWNADKGYFINDLSEKAGGKADDFGSDSLVVLSTGFLDPGQEQDRQKLERIVEHIQQNTLDRPFPLKYSTTNGQNRMHWTVKYFAPGYMGKGIWSHWGVEYVKTLLALSQTSDPAECLHLEDAREFLDLYAQNIAAFGGYPELYGQDGKPYQTLALRSVLHSGWVVNYEAAHAALESDLRTTSCQF